jgi:hypothetical protein
MMDFVCMANDGYLQWTELCVRAIERQQPGSKIHLYDLSESADSAMRARFARHASVRYRHFPPAQWKWPAWIEAAGFDFIWPRFGLRETLKYHSRRLRKLLGARNENWMTDKNAHTQRVRRSLRLFAQKPYVIQDALSSSPHNLAFIDVDAIVLKPLDSVFDRDFDLAVTAEAPEDVIIGPEPPECTERPAYPYVAINVGVIFVRNTGRVKPLLDAWIREMETVHHLSIEQTALANLIYRLAPHFYEAHYRTHTLDLGGGARVSVMSVPMALYNFTKIRHTDTALAPTASVAHFCGGKKQQRHWEWVHGLIAHELDKGEVR